MQPNIGRWPRNTIALPVCAGRLNPANSTCAGNKNSGRLRSARNACTGRVPRSMAATPAALAIGTRELVPRTIRYGNASLRLCRGFRSNYFNHGFHNCCSLRMNMSFQPAADDEGEQAIAGQAHARRN